MTTRDEWLALAGRCETAKGPDRELDADILSAWAPLDRNGTKAGWRMDGEPGDWAKPYTASLDAITALIERELPGRDVHSGTFRGRANGMIMNADRTAGPWREAATEPLARCAAFCRAKAEGTTP
jgi:hypothetical protein